MDFKDVGNILVKIAPMIATSLGGPLAGTAVAALGDALGVSEGRSEEDREKALVGAIRNATPDTLLAIKKAEQEYSSRMAELGFKNIEALEALAISDKDSARRREMVIKDSTPRNLAYVITLGFFLTLGFMLVMDVPAASRDLLNILLGMLAGAFLGVREYYFGSSASSKEKTRLLAEKQ